jgi:hypothetical protein
MAMANESRGIRTGFTEIIPGADWVVQQISERTRRFATQFCLATHKVLTRLYWTGAFESAQRLGFQLPLHLSGLQAVRAEYGSPPPH